MCTHLVRVLRHVCTWPSRWPGAPASRTGELVSAVGNYLKSNTYMCVLEAAQRVRAAQPAPFLSGALLAGAGAPRAAVPAASRGQRAGFELLPGQQGLRA